MAAAAAQDLPRVLDELIGEHRREGAWFVAKKNPLREERTSSLKIHDEGNWKDFGGSESGQDLVSLWAAVHGVKQGEAATALAEFLRLDGPPAKEERASARRQSGTGNDEMLLPVPKNAPDYRVKLIDRDWKDKDGQHIPGLGEAVGHWVYRNIDGWPMFIVVRWDVPEGHPHYEQEGGKKYRPLTCWFNKITGAMYWKKALPSAPRSIYNLHLLAKYPEAIVLIVEGEKAADALQALVDKYCPGRFVVTTSHNGKAGCRTYDWSPLHGRRSVSWADNDLADRAYDRPGDVYPATIAEILADQVVSMQSVDLTALAELLEFSELPAKFDAADLSLSAEQAAAFFAGFENTWGPVPAMPKRHPCIGADPSSRQGKNLAEWAEGVESDNDDSGHFGPKHVRLVKALEEYLRQQGITPDAAAGWRTIAGWQYVDTNLPDLVTDFLFEFRTRAPCSKSTAQETLEAIELRRRKDRRGLLMERVLSADADKEEAIAELQAWITAMTGYSAPLDLAIMKHFLWQVKRRAAGLPVEHDLMPVFTGLQGSGKSNAIKKLLSVLNELAIPIRASLLTDERHAPALARSLVGFWDEMEGARGANLEALKFTLTADKITYRPMATNRVVEIPRLMSFIAASNFDLEEMIQDTSGNRRFAELKTPERCDWDTLNSLDYELIWAAVSAEEPAPILPYINELREHQAEREHRDLYTMWAEDEHWREIETLPARDVSPQRVDKYDHTKGYSFEDLAMRLELFRSRVGNPSLSLKIFATRLRQLGFVRRRPTLTDEHGAKYREWRYFLPANFLPAWCQGSVSAEAHHRQASTHDQDDPDAPPF